MTQEKFKEFDHEYGSFLKMNDKEPMHRLSKFYYDNFSHEVTAVAEHSSLAEADNVHQHPGNEGIHEFPHILKKNQHIDTSLTSDTNNTSKSDSVLGIDEKINDEEQLQRLKQFYSDFSHEVTGDDEHPNLADAGTLRQLPSNDVTDEFLEVPQNIQQIIADTTNNPSKFNSELDTIGSESNEPPELQNLADSEDPDYDYDSSVILSSDSQDETLKEHGRKKKKCRKIRKNVKMCVTQHDDVPQSGNEQQAGISHGSNRSESVKEQSTDSLHQDDDTFPRRKTKKVAKRDTNTRKKSRNVSSWIKTQAKEKRNSGQPYWSTSSKAYVPGKVLRESCNETCKFKCSKKISDAQRQSIFSRFWQIGCLGHQREFVRRYISDVSQPLSSLPRKRANNQAYNMEVSGQTIRVCKKYVVATLGISHRWITTIRNKTSDGFVQADRRGHHNNKKKIDEEILNDMRAHIRSIPRIESHYLREQTTREYIEGGKSIIGIYRDYVDFCKKQGKPFGSEDKFRRIFDTEFNISFFVPKKDQCDFCSAFNNLLPEEREQRNKEHEQHLVNKMTARDEKNKDKVNTGPNTILCTYNLQKSLITPNGVVSQFYYKSKLSTYNFTIYEMKTTVGYCNVWHEGDAKRGSIEIATCVFRFIQAKVENAPGDEQLDFIFYSDNCAGQQKNKFMILMYMCAILQFPRVASITHKFLVTGHTQNEGDNMHSVIEKEIRRARDSGPIYIPAQYIQLIRSSKKNPPYYKVREFTYSDFIDFKSLETHVGENFNVDREGKRVPFNSIVAIKITQETPLSFFYKLSFNEEFKEIPVNERIELKTDHSPTKKRKITRATTKKRSEDNNPIEKRKEILRGWKSPAYDQPCGIGQHKKKDLMSLVDGVLIPAAYKDFYTNLAVRKVTKRKDELEVADVDSDFDT